MSWNLSLAQSWWWLAICLLLGVLYASVLYFKNRKTEDLLKPLVRNLLAVTRCFAVSLLAFLLLGPVLKYLGYNEEKPIITLLLDNSNSLQGQEVETKLTEKIDLLREALNEKYRVETYSFSNTISPNSQLDLSGSETNIGQTINFLSKNYINQNLGAAILVSDGINNAGSNPLFATERVKQPIFTIGIGDTTRYADLAIKNVLHNSIAYLGNDFSVKVELQADLLKGKTLNLEFLENGKLLERIPMRINANSTFSEVDLIGSAGKVGRTKYTVRVTSFKEEENRANNTYSFYVDVIDGKKKVAIWAAAPHPDIGAIASAINKNDNYTAEIELNQFKPDTKTDLVILHNWFQNNLQLSLFEKLKSNGISTWVVLGSSFNAAVFNRNSAGINYTSSGNGTVDALPRYNSDFQFYEMSDGQKERINDWSPLKAPFGKFKGIKPSEVSLFQTIGSVNTEQPLMALLNNKYRLGVLSGTGIWRWRLLDFEKNGNHETFEDFVTKTVQFLAVKDDKKLLKVYPSAKQYGVGEQVTILGELYNQSLDAIAEQEINVVLKDEEGKNYKHTMSPNGNQYKLLLKGLQAGSYTFSANSTVGGIKLRDNGYFIVQGQQKERLNLTADFKLLNDISKSTGGSFYTLDEIDKLTNSLVESNDLKTIIKEDTKMKDLLDFKWFFWLLVVLLALEWLIRKLSGSI